MKPEPDKLVRQNGFTLWKWKIPRNLNVKCQFGKHLKNFGEIIKYMNILKNKR